MLRIGGRSAVLSGEVDAVPADARIVLVPGFGVVAAGPDLRAARTRVEIAAHTHASVAATLDRFGGVSWLTDAEVHDFEYWPLELYKLTRAPPPPELAGHIVLVTGAASGIGRDIAHDLAARGAHLLLADIDADGLAGAAEGLGRAATVASDLTDPAVVDSAVRAAVESFGGLDAVVLNAGVASTGALESLSDEEWRRSLEINLTAHFLLTRRVLGLLREQGIGGSLVYVASKNAFAPGAGFGPYSVAKAGLVQLMRIAALEGGSLGIRSNAVNPDAIFAGSKLWSDDLRRERAEAHGVPLDEIETFYASRSLLGRAVTGEDVAEAVAFLVSDRSRSTTGAVLPVDGGVPAAFPR
jgi:NAD(P)-dependent dehydrogenase (short-subunit alcohol dehydrogenase family)